MSDYEEEYVYEDEAPAEEEEEDVETKVEL